MSSVVRTSLALIALSIALPGDRRVAAIRPSDAP